VGVLHALRDLCNKLAQCRTSRWIVCLGHLQRRICTQLNA
jgi:hypothetical protein